MQSKNVKRQKDIFAITISCCCSLGGTQFKQQTVRLWQISVGKPLIVIQSYVKNFGIKT